jgi:hypothetical protein
VGTRRYMQDIRSYSWRTPNPEEEKQSVFFAIEKYAELQAAQIVKP